MQPGSRVNGKNARNKNPSDLSPSLSVRHGSPSTAFFTGRKAGAASGRPVRIWENRDVLFFCASRAD